MMRVLKARPDVDTPTVRAASRDGAKYLLIEYRAQERSSWTTPTSFSVSLDDNGKTRASALLPGMFSPLEGLDTHVTDEVMRAWRSECGVVSMAVLI